VIDARAIGMDRTASRHELLQTPTASLDHIRQRWASHHTLAAAEWDVVAEYVHIGTDAERQEPPTQPVVPSRQSYLTLLETFEAVYEHRTELASPHAWTYFSNLRGDATAVRLSDDDADQRHQVVLHQIAHRRDLLRRAEAWEAPGNLGWCLRTAMREEGIDSTTLDHLLGPSWPTLWGLAARGHWIRHRQPVRTAGTTDEHGRCPVSVPQTFTEGDLTVSCTPSGRTAFVMQIDLGSPRGFGYRIGGYLELVEFRAMLEATGDQAWHGRHFFTIVSQSRGLMTWTLGLKRQDMRVEFSACEWQALRDLVGQAWQSPELQRCVQELQQQYGEHG
jgi:hypothetical protein